jgi:quinol monooxygenase YgiN
VLVLIEGQVRPGVVDELRAVMAEALPDARAADGCREIRVHTGQQDPSRWVWVERWASRQHYERYMGRRAEVGAVDRIGALFLGPLSIRFFDPVEALNGDSSTSDATS